jgi:hypothetical protein
MGYGSLTTLSILESCDYGQGETVTRHMTLHMDNWTVHNAEHTWIKIRSMTLRKHPHPLILQISAHATSGFSGEREIRCEAENLMTHMLSLRA